jgi:FAD/FMN-containing dehydrogenase
LASKSEIPFLATGGGHGTSGTLGEIMNGLEVDLGNFNSVTLNSEDNRLTVGGGTKFSAFINLLYDAGKELREWLSRGVHATGNNLSYDY